MAASIHEKSFFQRRVLISFWALEWLFELAVIAVLAQVWFDHWPDTPGFSYGDGAWLISGFPGQLVAGLVFTCIPVCMLLRIGPVVLYSRKRLTPLRYFLFEIPQVLIWPAVWAYGLYVVQYQTGIIPVFIMCGVLQLLYMGSAIYSCIVLHQCRIWRQNNKKSSICTEPVRGMNSESMLVQQEVLSRQKYATAPVIDDDDDEEVPVSPTHDVSFVLPTYEEAQSNCTSTQSYTHRHEEKPRKDGVKVGYGYN